jgi:serine protease inhibitor
MDKLYKDVLQNVLSFLSPIDHLHTITISKQFYNALKDTEIFERICHSCTKILIVSAHGFFFTTMNRKTEECQKLIQQKYGTRFEQSSRKPFLCLSCLILYHRRTPRFKIHSLPFTDTVRMIYIYYPKKNHYYYDFVQDFDIGLQLQS